MSILTIDKLNKSFGSHIVIDGLSLTVPEGSIYGFLGPNGAGKTTTMKMILGLLKPDSGTITVCGENVCYGETKTNRHIGFLPDVPEFYNYMRPKEYLALCGEITGLESAFIKTKSAELLALVGLNTNKKIGGFSRGMKQRLGIAQALLNEPKLLICDEPTSALDPVGRKEILDILSSVKGKTTIIFSTHILSDVERICDHVAVLNKGKLALNSTLSELKQSKRNDKICIEFISKAELERFIMADTIKLMERNQDPDSFVVTIHSNDIAETKRQIFHVFSDLSIYPERVEVLEPTLESLFMEVIQ